MADWKLPVSYNYNPPYHAYAYGLMYQAGPEQNHQNVSGWAEAAYNSGVTGGYYSSPAQQHQSPPRTPEEHLPANSHYPPGSSVLYFGDSHTQSGRLFLSHNRTQYDQRTKETERPSSDTPSDSEAHTPDSWTSGSSKEGCIPQHQTWTRRDLDEEETDGGSPNGSEQVSSSLPEEEPTNTVLGNEDSTQESLPLSPPDKIGTVTPKATPKARTAFSEGQMNALIHRFNLQKYLTPAEMKTLAGETGLTYKQVKTWFQNRRMKLKRHQKDNTWVSERYQPNASYPNIPPHSQFQGEHQAHMHDHYNQQFRETVCKKSPPPRNLPYYAGGYPPRPASSPQASARPQVNWPLPPAVTHYEYNPSGYSTGSGNNNNNTSLNSDDGTPAAHIPSPMRMTMVHSGSQ